jgi:hypothetical protein
VAGIVLFKTKEREVVVGEAFIKQHHTSVIHKEKA